jgi:cytochrome c1
MKKTLLPLALFSSLLLADGYEIYKNNCASCHIEMISKEEVLNNLDKMKAPPMVEVSNQIRSNIIIKDDDEDVHKHLFVLFVKDYIRNPELSKSMCHPGALERFDVMPSLKTKLTEQEAQEVATWLYERYEGVSFR